MTPLQQASRLKTIQKKISLAQRQTVSRVVRSTRTNLIRKISKSTGIKQKDIRKTSAVRKLKIENENVTGTIIVKPNNPSLRRFVRGVYVTPRGGRKGGLNAIVLGQRKFFERAFWVTMPNGKRLPAIVSPRRGFLKVLRGPSSRGAVLKGNQQDPQMLPVHFKRFARDRFELEWRRLIQHHLRDLV